MPATLAIGAQRPVQGRRLGTTRRRNARVVAPKASNQEGTLVDEETGFEMRKDGVKKEAQETILTPRCGFAIVCGV